MGGDLGGAILLAAGFLALLAVAEAWRRLGDPEPEQTRKLAHLGAGAGCVLMPFLIRSPWVVLALAASMSALFALGARFGFLPSLHRVERKTRGSEYYPLAIFLVYVIAYDEPATYTAAVLVLAVADAFAALVGVRYGRTRYEVEDSQKSVEGSAVFFLIAFLAIHLPLLLMTDLDRTQTVLSAVLVAALVTAFEAISLSGADNLFIPVAVAVCLQKINSKPLGEAIYQNLSLAAIALVVTLIARRARWFNPGATLVVVLYAYGAWSLGSWLWSVPMLVALASAVAVGLRAGERGRGSQKVRATAAAVLPSFLFLIVSQLAPSQDPFYGPYLAALATAIGCWIRAQSALFRGGPRWGLLAAIAFGAAITVGLVPWLIDPGGSPGLLGWVAAVTTAAVVGESAWSLAAHRDEPSNRWTARRFVASLGAGLLILGLGHAGVIESWNPSAAPFDPQRLFWTPGG